MSEVKSLKCPNCGAQVSGEGEITCPYCDSKLSITRETESAGRMPEFTIALNTLKPTGSYFSSFSGIEITKETTDVQFLPTIYYDKLSGGILNPNLKNEAKEIIGLVENIQDAINSEDLNLFISQFAKRDKKYYNKAKVGIRNQFKTSNIKHYAVSIEFNQLSTRKAKILVKFEWLKFRGSSIPQSETTIYSCQLANIDGQWQFVSGKKVAIPGLLASAFSSSNTAVLVIFIVGVVLLVFGIPIAFGVIPDIYRGLDVDKRDAIDEFFDSCDNEESTGLTVGVEEDRLVLYAEPTTLSEQLYYVDAGLAVGIAEVREDYWLRVKMANGNEGWTRAKVHGYDINGMEEESTCPSYNLTGQQNQEFVGKTVVVGPKRVDVKDRPSPAGEYVVYVNTGEKLDILEAGDDFWVKVRTERGEVGWARCSFVGSHVNGKDY